MASYTPPFSPSPTMEAAPTHLIIVCCHGIWTGGLANGYDEAEWLIAGFQKGETATFVQHVREGVRILAEDQQNAVLVFSGGPTRSETQLSEAQSYADIASMNNYWGLLPASAALPRILIEARALDSYHNVLFSLTLFYAQFGAWPTHTTIVSHAFKRERLVDLHCHAALDFRRVTYVGVDPPIAADKDAAMAGVAKARDEWLADLHGRGGGLKGKRQRRNPWGFWQGVFGEGVGVDVRMRSGLITKGEGDEETVVDEAPKPWA